VGEREESEEKGGKVTISEIVAIGAVVLSVGTNVALYVHLSSVMNARFESVERRLEMILGSTHDMDLRLTKIEAKS
jgi:hypothetical protein